MQSARQQSPFASYDDLRERIAGADVKLPKRLAQAAHFALSRPDEFALGTAASLASAAGVQPSTMVRLARHLGYDGFSDMQSVFRDRLRSRASSYEERLANLAGNGGTSSREASLVRGFMDVAIESLKNASDALDPQSLSTAIAILAEAETIHLLARRRAFPLAAHMSYVFSRLSMRSAVLSFPNDIVEEAAAMVTPRDAVIVCSFNPYSDETVRLAEQFAARGIPLVAITDTPLSPIARCANVWLEAAESDHAGFRSLSAGIALASALPVAVAERRRPVKTGRKPEI